MLPSFVTASSILHQRNASRLMEYVYQLWSMNSDYLSSSNSGSHDLRKYLFKPIKKDLRTKPVCGMYSILLLGLSYVICTKCQ